MCTEIEYSGVQTPTFYQILTAFPLTSIQLTDTENQLCIVPVEALGNDGIDEDQTKSAIYDNRQDLQGHDGGVRVQPATVSFPILLPYNKETGPIFTLKPSLLV